MVEERFHPTPEQPEEEWFDPPADLVKRVVASFKRRKNRLADRFVRPMKLQFDSWTRLAPSGVRGTVQERQILFAENGLDVDVQIIKENIGLFTLQGQVLESVAGPQGLEGIEVQLMVDGFVYRRALVDSTGYFRFTFVPAGVYTLRLILEDRDIVVQDLAVEDYRA